ncbi:MAG: phage major capsid protein [Pseudonocardiaceae bacterium]|nr:MAG: phage major capsid protein [Pseudonocardiaceae bacterium]
MTIDTDRGALTVRRKALVDDMAALHASVRGRDLTPTEADIALGLKANIDRIDNDLRQMDAKASDAALRKSIADLGGGLGLGDDGDDVRARGLGHSHTKSGTWAERVADRMAKTATATGVKALTTGSIDVPVPIAAEVVAWPQHPTRIIDLLVDRQALTGRTFTYLRQVARTNNAGPVADGATKPTSLFTVTEVEDRARVWATLAEPFPERYIGDHSTLVRWLEDELQGAVMASIENQVIAGDGTGENVEGILATSGTVGVPFNTNMLVSLRKARTALELISETPNAWVLNPADLETIDLMREDGTGGGFLVGGTSPANDNVFGNLPRVPSPVVPAGTAILGDWRQVRLLVREELRLDADRSGDNFKKNLVTLRTEGQFGVAVLRPQAFAVVDLAA